MSDGAVLVLSLIVTLVAVLLAYLAWEELRDAWRRHNTALAWNLHEDRPGHWLATAPVAVLEETGIASIGGPSRRSVLSGIAYHVEGAA